MVFVLASRSGSLHLKNRIDMENTVHVMNLTSSNVNASGLLDRSQHSKIRGV